VIVGEEAADAVDKKKIKNKTTVVDAKPIKYDFLLISIYPLSVHSLKKLNTYI
jgi:hypothetical protein